MLNIFPSLLTYGLVGPLLIRIVLAAAVAWIGCSKIKTNKETQMRALGGAEIIIALFLLVGLLTQLMALLTAVILIVKLTLKVKQGALLTDGVNYYLILLVLAISLMFTGAGYLAFDLPL